MNRSAVLGSALVAVVALLAAGSGRLRAAVGHAGQRLVDRLVVARSTDAVSLDPARASDIESLEVAEQVYGRLVRFAAGRLEPEPDLATRWSVSADGTVWTFDLRPDVRFHDGTPFDADAVVFSFERQIIPDHPAHEPDFVWTHAYHNIRRVGRSSRCACSSRSIVPTRRSLPTWPWGRRPSSRRRRCGGGGAISGATRLAPAPIASSSGSPATASRSSAMPTTGISRRAPVTSCCRDARLAAAAAGAGIGRGRHDPAARARRYSARQPPSRSRARDGARRRWCRTWR